MGGGGGMVGARMEAEAEDTKAVVVMEIVGDGDVTTVLAGEEAVAKVLGGTGSQ